MHLSMRLKRLHSDKAEKHSCGQPCCLCCGCFFVIANATDLIAQWPGYCLLGLSCSSKARHSCKMPVATNICCGTGPRSSVYSPRGRDAPQQLAGQLTDLKIELARRDAEIEYLEAQLAEAVAANRPHVKAPADNSPGQVWNLRDVSPVLRLIPSVCDLLLTHNIETSWARCHVLFLPCHVYPLVLVAIQFAFICQVMHACDCLNVDFQLCCAFGLGFLHARRAVCPTDSKVTTICCTRQVWSAE